MGIQTGLDSRNCPYLSCDELLVLDKQSQHGGHERGIIRFRTDDDDEKIAFNNITIADNTFNQFDNMILEVANTDGLVFKNNTITNSGIFPQLYQGSPAFTIKTSRNIVFENNDYRGNAKQILDTDENLSTLKFR